MHFRRLLTVICIMALSGANASAQSLFDRISKGASKAGEVAQGAVKNFENTVEGTVDLAKGEETPEQGRDMLDLMATETLIRLFTEDADALDLFQKSVGYAVFDTRKMVALGFAAGFGRGVAVSRQTGTKRYMKMGTGGVGLSFGLGGFETQVVILFEDDTAFYDFIRNGYDATADAGAMFGDDKEGAAVRFIDGRSIFVLSKKGWKVSATAAGTKYWTDPDLN